MTIKDIAQMAGVSISTVSKIMNHKDDSISSETRERVLRIVKEFNYTPYSNTLTANSKTFIIGVLACSCEANRTLSGIMAEAQARGYSVLSIESEGDILAEYKGANALCRHRVDAVLWEPANADHLQCQDVFHASGIPFFLFNSEADGANNIDFAQMGFMATSLLIQKQHRDIACLLSPGMRAEQFLEGYKKCLFDQGIPFQEHLVFHDINDVLLHSITTHAVTGIVSSLFASALHLYGKLNHLHYRIPHDVSLVSLRNDAKESIDFPLISTIAIPYFQFGKHLCRNLIQKIEQDAVLQPFEAAIKLDNESTIEMPYQCLKKKIIVVGSINIDNYLKVEELPVTGKTVLTTDSSVYPGGKGINQSIGASRLGAQVCLIGAVGNDMDSNLIFSTLDKHSIDSTGIRRYAGSATGKAYIFVQPDGESMISILSGANGILTPDDVLHNGWTFENCSYCLIQTEVPQSVLIEAAKLAHKYGAKTILKPSACSHLEPELLEYVDILVPNFNEINILCPGKDISGQADTFLEKGIEAVIITLGEKGCYLKTKETEQRFPACDFTPIDNTGAGDAFICALAVYLQKGYSLESAIRIATYAAGFSISREGVYPSLIDKNTLESYILQKEPELLK